MKNPVIAKIKNQGIKQIVKDPTPAPPKSKKLAGMRDFSNGSMGKGIDDSYAKMKNPRVFKKG